MTPPVELLFFAFLAGLVDSAVGGGGLIQVPALLLFLPGVPIPTLMGTNKLASISGTTMSTLQYARRVAIPWRSLVPAALTALVFSFLGARTVSRLDPEVLRPIMLVLLVVMAVYTFAKKDFGHVHAPKFTAGHQSVFSVLAGAVLGFYDGFFGPGTGSVLIFIFVAGFGYEFITASASAKVLNLATNLSAVLYFAFTRQILLTVAIPMALCNMLGSYTGSRLAMGRGRPFIRWLFLVVLVGLIAKLALDLRRG